MIKKCKHHKPILQLIFIDKKDNIEKEEWYCFRCGEEEIRLKEAK